MEWTEQQLTSILTEHIISVRNTWLLVDFLPTTVIIMLGTNDARTNIYSEINRFVSDYEHMISRIQNFSSKPQIFLVEPPPIYSNTMNLDGTDLVQGVIPRIQQIADTMHLPLIDAYTPMLNHPDYFTDGVHPNSKGAQVIANTIYNAITAKFKIENFTQ